MPLKYLRTWAYFRNLISNRAETYAVRDHLGYKHWKTGQKSIKAVNYRSSYWC
jgi:hypothetical protein